MTLVEFLLARITEDEPTTNNRGDASQWEAEPSGLEVRNPRWNIAIAYTNHQMDGYHIARFDPARVLAECEAKRRIIALHDHWHECTFGTDLNEVGAVAEDELCPTLRYLALPYADHPEFREEWRAEARTASDS